MIYEEKISVIVPVYNVQVYLKKCLTSIISNTYSCLEIILVDDGSTDQSGTICDQFANLDKRIKVIHKKNGGLSSARNAGLDIANGDYIFFVDSDDWLEKSIFEKMVKSVHLSKADIVQCGYVRETDSTNNYLFKPENKIFLGRYEISRELLLQNNIIVNAWNKLYRKDVIGDVRFFEGKNNEDNIFITDLLPKIKSISVISDPLYHYVIRSNSITQAKTSEKKVEDLYFAINYMRSNIVSYDSSLSSIASFFYCKGLFYILLLFKNKEPNIDTYNKLINDYLNSYKELKKSKVYSEQRITDRIRLRALYMGRGLFLKIYSSFFVRIISINL